MSNISDVAMHHKSQFEGTEPGTNALLMDT